MMREAQGQSKSSIETAAAATDSAVGHAQDAANEAIVDATDSAAACQNMLLWIDAKSIEL